jgi:hypothetical protein
MATTVARLSSNGVYFANAFENVYFDEVSYTISRTTSAAIFSSEFDEITILGGSISKRDTYDGRVLVSGYFDEVTGVLPANAIAYYTGSTLNGWTNADNSSPPTIDAVVGNPAPSFKVTTRGFFRNLGQTFHNKTITFDFRPGTNFDGGLSFANASNGNGTYRAGVQLKQGTSVAGQGLRFGSNGGWLYFGVGGPETLSVFETINIWYAIKIQITSGGVCTWFVNGVQQASTVTLNALYTTANTTDNYFGFITNTSTANFDNLTIYQGIY